MKSRRHHFAALLLGAMAISMVGCNSGSTSPTNPIDLSPPQAPTNLHSTSDAGINRDWLVWDPSASASVSSYEIYSTPPGGSSELVGTVDASTTDYILPLVGSDTIEYYRVRAVGTNDVPSAFTSTLGVPRTGWSGETTATPDPNHGTENGS